MTFSHFSFYLKQMENKLLRLLLLLAVAFLIATWTSEAQRRPRKLFYYKRIPPFYSWEIKK